MPPKRARSSQPHATRSQQPLDVGTVVRTAADIADRDGWSAVTLSRVARELHRHVTSMYSHVDSVDALRREVALLAAGEMAALLWTAALGRSRDDALVAIADVYRTYPREHPGRGEALLTYRSRDDPDFVAATVHMSEPLRATLRSYGLDDRQVEHAHRVFSATLRGFSTGEAVGLYEPGGDEDETYRQILELFRLALEEGSWPEVPARRRAKGQVSERGAPKVPGAGT
ncbi:MAG TPA: TetR-like C-terminal domain-containing protein [Acidimicrobiia bacterium]|jgi:AcrR family transcriptional regulator